MPDSDIKYQFSSRGLSAVWASSAPCRNTFYPSSADGKAYDKHLRNLYKYKTSNLWKLKSNLDHLP